MSDLPKASEQVLSGLPPVERDADQRVLLGQLLGLAPRGGAKHQRLERLLCRAPACRRAVREAHECIGRQRAAPVFGPELQALRLTVHARSAVALRQVDGQHHARALAWLQRYSRDGSDLKGVALRLLCRHSGGMLVSAGVLNGLDLVERLQRLSQRLHHVFTQQPELPVQQSHLRVAEVLLLSRVGQEWRVTEQHL